LALGTTALCVLVLLPFAARFLPEMPLGGSFQPAASDAAVLMRRQQYQPAYELLSGVEPEADHQAIHQYRLAVCERVLGLPDSAYARLLRLEGAIPSLESYRRLWLARSLETLAMSHGDSAAAISAYRDLLLLHTSPVVADSSRLYLASLLCDTGQFGEALRIYQDHQTAAGTSAEVLSLIATVSQLDGRHEGARSAQVELIGQFPGHHLALNVARRMRPETWEERYMRAQVYYHHRDDRRAIDDLRKLLRTDIRNEQAPRAEYVLGRAYARSGQLARARHTFERLHELHGWPSALYRLAALHVSDDQDLKAAEAYAAFARMYPQHELADDALWQAAKAAERRDRFALAGEIYTTLASGYAASEYAEEASWGKGFSLYCQLQYEEALREFHLVAEQARQPHIIDQSLFWEGKSALHLGHKDEAEVLFAKAASGFPRSYYASRAVSMGYGKPELARRRPVLRAPLAASDLDLRHVEGEDHVRRALALGDLGLAAAAEKELRLAEHLNAGDAESLLILRDSYDLLGLHDRALLLSTRSARQDDDIRRLYPSYYWDEVTRAAQDASVDPYLVLSVIRQESYFNEDALSHAGAMGLMQIMPQTGRKLAQSLGVRSYEQNLLFDPSVSILLGSRFLADQVRSFTPGSHGLQYPLGLAAYNAGPRVARRWLERFPIGDADAFVERIPYKETRLYVKKVLKNFTIYKTLIRSESDA
ncbi:MAG: transglycosylase SLT domain-containing protein, partial [Gemmatimonadetes bacterium]|nr:transglycosylase SLT domain-containing protein [Gemmatimonadota bacterium]